MRTFGGFLPLETASGSSSCHSGAIAMTSGRAAWHAILLDVRPLRVRLPFYICDAAIEPLLATDTPYDFYAIDEHFLPVEDISARDDLWLVINYFGMFDAAVSDISRAHPDRVVIDDTQAFFRAGDPERWSFNSARKFFGVPDGAYLYGPASDRQLPASDLDDCDHLIARAAGDERALDLFRAHEAKIGIDPRAMSATSARLLASVDAHHARAVRRDNFRALHNRLKDRNGLEVSVDDRDCGPMCYPFLPASSVDRQMLARAGVFVPTLWPELAARSGGGFAWERRLGCQLLPLPVDHRYVPADMDVIADRLLQVIA